MRFFNDLLTSLVGVFLPSMAGTKISFMRDILKEEKLALKQNEVVHMEIPNYQEISVKNLYADAISDQVQRQLHQDIQVLLGLILPSKVSFASP